jgi:hypothetical protein
MAGTVLALLLAIVALILVIILWCQNKRAPITPQVSGLMAVPKKALQTHVRYMVIFKAETSYSFLYCGQMPTIRESKLRLEELNVHIDPKYKVIVSTINVGCDCGSQFILREQLLNPLPRFPSFTNKMVQPNWHYPKLEMDNIPLPELPSNASTIDQYMEISDKRIATAPDNPPNSPELIRTECQSLLNPSRSLNRDRKFQARTYIHVPY